MGSEPQLNNGIDSDNKAKVAASVDHGASQIQEAAKLYLDPQGNKVMPWLNLDMEAGVTGKNNPSLPLVMPNGRNLLADVSKGRK